MSNKSQSHATRNAGTVPEPASQPNVTMNRIVEIRITLADGDGLPGSVTSLWHVEVRKEFAPENGGGEQTFTEYARNGLHGALDVARGMVTLSPAVRGRLGHDPGNNNCPLNADPRNESCACGWGGDGRE